MAFLCFWRGSHNQGGAQMTDIEEKALALLNEMAALYAKRAFTVKEPYLSGHRVIIGFDNLSAADDFFHSLLVLSDFIPKPKPDPLVRVINEVIYAQPHGDIDEVRIAGNFRAALDAIGLEIREKGQ
jgi:hypothetical protein